MFLQVGYIESLYNYHQMCLMAEYPISHSDGYSRHVFVEQSRTNAEKANASIIRWRI